MWIPLLREWRSSNLQWKLFFCQTRFSLARIPISQGSVNGGFQKLVGVWSGERVPAPHSNLNVALILPLFLPHLNLCSAGNLEPRFGNHGLQTLWLETWLQTENLNKEIWGWGGVQNWILILSIWELRQDPCRKPSKHFDLALLLLLPLPPPSLGLLSTLQTHTPLDYGGGGSPP